MFNQNIQRFQCFLVFRSTGWLLHQKGWERFDGIKTPQRWKLFLKHRLGTTMEAREAVSSPWWLPPLLQPRWPRSQLDVNWQGRPDLSHHFLDALASLRPILFSEWVSEFFWIADSLRIHQWKCDRIVPISKASVLVLSVPSVMSNVKCQMSNVKCKMSNI